MGKPNLHGFSGSHTSLNPAYTIGEQMTETIRNHRKVGQSQAVKEAETLLEAVQLSDPARMMRQYPHQISGGQKQRIVIAQALSCRPELLILDEPTTALDVTTELRFLDLLADLRSRFDTAFLYITHDLGIVARIADHIGVIYAGQIVETGTREEIFRFPCHPYTRGLMQSIPDIYSRQKRLLVAMPGMMPDLIDIPQGCIFSPRCAFAMPGCLRKTIALETVFGKHEAACIRWRDLPSVDNLRTVGELLSPANSSAADGSRLQVRDVVCHYELSPSFLARMTGAKRQVIQAVDGLSFDVLPGQTFGLVGESGCGKSTIAKAIVRLQAINGGKILFEGKDILSLSSKDRNFRRSMQIVFQNPDSSLNPRHRIRNILGRPITLFGVEKSARKVTNRCIALLEMVRLGPKYLYRYPHELSGGEKQRVAIARAFAGQPAFIVCDEVTSALDVSVQASVVNLLMDLQRKFQTSYLFISHDLNIVRQISDFIGVMYLGRLVETGSTEQVFLPPYHPYTRALLSAISLPTLNQDHHKVRLEGIIPSIASPPSGCRFHTRCPEKYGPECEQIEPTLQEASPGHFIACHTPVEHLAGGESVFSN